MDEKTSKLIEPGVKYFFCETLKNCKNKKRMYFNTVLNVGLLILFISLFGVILLYKKKTKLSKSQIKERNLNNQKYILEKARMLNKEVQKQNNQLITNLPNAQFESNFEKLHKNYYNI